MSNTLGNASWDDVLKSRTEPDGIVDGVVAGWPGNDPACIAIKKNVDKDDGEPVQLSARVITRLEVYGDVEQMAFRWGGVATSPDKVPYVLREMARAFVEFAEKWENGERSAKCMEP